MKIIKPSVQFFGAVPTDYTNALRFIEMAGRTCYKSEDKITDSSAEAFVKRLISAGHLAMVEHSNFVVCLDRPKNQAFEARMLQIVGKYLSIAWDDNFCYVGGSLTGWEQRCAFFTEQHLSEDVFAPFLSNFGLLFGYISSKIEAEDYYSDWQVCPHNEIPAALHRYSTKFICDRGVSHELVRHRPCSFAQESTRYVNYGGKDMEFIEPAGFEGWDKDNQFLFKHSCQESSAAYNQLLAAWDAGKSSLKPQQARAVLPNALKTEIVVTADAAEWAHIKKLRTHPSAHPDMVQIMNMMPWKEFIQC
jgi:thymidylate synthase (FAD)